MFTLFAHLGCVGPQHTWDKVNRTPWGLLWLRDALPSPPSWEGAAFTDDPKPASLSHGFGNRYGAGPWTEAFVETNLSTPRMQRNTHPIPRGALIQSPKELSDLTLKPCGEVPSLVMTLQFRKAVSFRVPVLRECQWNRCFCKPCYLF